MTSGCIIELWEIQTNMGLKRTEGYLAATLVTPRTNGGGGLGFSIAQRPKAAIHF